MKLLHTVWRFVFTSFFGSLNFRSVSDLFSLLVSIWGPFGILFGRLGNFENGARTLTGIRFSHFGLPFFRLDF